MIASLPMYDTGQTAAANDRFWQAIRRHYGRGPVALTRAQDPHQTWEAPDLVFSQTCGLPFRSGLHQHVHLVGTPDYGVEGCAAGYYCSCIVVRADDPRERLADFAGARLARNDIRSQSGWAALVEHLRDTAPGTLLAPAILDTGSHAASVRAVAEGRADIAAIDAVTWAFLGRDADTTYGLRVLARTRPTPGLPYITGRGEDARALAAAVARAITDLAPSDRDTLMIRGVASIPSSVYLAVPLP